MIHPHTPMNGQALAFTDAVEARRDIESLRGIGLAIVLIKPDARRCFCGLPAVKGKEFCAACQSIIDEPSIGAPS